ncbi:MAG: hemolysin III [Nitrospirae bacterium GWC2_57_13]|jgi:hemolysin III|nr:MAG: hemolysin III [Nitrospirae bacterium GWC1_57_7]OGW29995.1 MAG: hemolysin III [Nitrospirae bacterium GWC2_57_13]HAR46430.1 hemolysin III [Nitrospiraceae bacterium]HAS53350.1 hemolysin III [Nitrospiraceae bacterium]
MYKGERFNSISHLAGAVIAVAGAVTLVVLAVLTGDPWKITSFSIYGGTLVSLYVFSTLYHSLQGEVKNLFQKLDHSAIYLLIAGTYTPFTLVTLRGAWGWSLFGVVWGLAVVGIIVDMLHGKRMRIIPVVIYILMGWIVVVAIKPMLAALPGAGFAWLLAGGVCYTGGIVFYVLDKRLAHSHGIWHLFVLAGSICHFISIAFYVL